MKVLFLTNVPSPYRVDFFNELGKYCELTVLYERKKVNYRNQSWNRYKAVSFQEVYLRSYKLVKNCIICFEILKYLKNKQDIIVISGYHTPTGILAILYLKIKKIPFIISCDGGMIGKEKRFIKYIKSKLISSPNDWLSTGESVNEYLTYYGAKKDRIHFYPFTSVRACSIEKNVVDISSKRILRKELNMYEEYIIITVGRFIPRKGFDTLIKACDGLGINVGLYIIGDRPTTEYVSLRKNTKNVNIHFVDFLDQLELKKYYLSADLFVLPTKVDIWGLVINEAMASGLPIITTNMCVAGKELLKYDNGIIVEVDNIEQMNQSIKYILSDSKLRKEMSINTLKIIKEYTIEKMAQTHINIFKSVLER